MTGKFTYGLITGPRSGTSRLLLATFTLCLISIQPARSQDFKFRGQAIGWGVASKMDVLRGQVGLSYIPELSFKEIDIDIEWQGVGVNEKGIDASTGKILVEVDEKYFRPAEVELLLGDPTKAEKELGWKRKVSFQELVAEMVRYDLENDDFGGDEA